MNAGKIGTRLASMIAEEYKRRTGTPYNPVARENVTDPLSGLMDGVADVFDRWAVAMSIDRACRRLVGCAPDLRLRQAIYEYLRGDAKYLRRYAAEMEQGAREAVALASVISSMVGREESR